MATSMSRGRISILVGGLVLGAIVCLTGGTLLRMHALVTSGRMVRGRIVECIPSHRTIRFQYIVDGQEYVGESQGQPGRAGDSVDLWFIPSKPGEADAGEPTANFANELTSTLFIALVMPALSALIVWFRLGRRGPARTAA